MSKLIRFLGAACTLGVVAVLMAPSGCGSSGKSNPCDGTPLPSTCVCKPASLGCVGETYSVCKDDGMGYTPRQVCGTGAHPEMVCDSARGCLLCHPNTRACNGFDVEMCSADGFGKRREVTCGASEGQVCSDGECKNACGLAAESRSYQGCEYYAVDLDNAGLSETLNAAGQQFSVVISNPSPLPADVKVEQNDAAPGAVPTPSTVKTAHLEPGDLKILDLPQREVDGSTPGLVNDGPGTFLSSNAYRITSTAPIVAYQFNPLENVNVFSNDASLLIPTAAVDREYIAMGWPQTIALTTDSMTNSDVNLRAFLTIVGIKDGITTVTINSKAPVVAGGTIPAIQVGETYEAKLGPFDVLNLETGSFNADFTGTTVSADQPVAVFSGSEASDVPHFNTLSERQCCADHLEEQLFPTVELGTKFVAVKSAERTKYVKEAGGDIATIREKEWFRVLGTEEFTNVVTSLPPPQDKFQVVRRGFKDLEVDRDFTISASAPIIVGQLNGSQFTTGIPNSLPGGDPSLTLLPPVEQYRTEYNFLVPNKYAFDFLLIAAPVGANITYDGGPLPDRCTMESAGTLKIVNEMVEFNAIKCPLSAPKIIPNKPSPQNVDPGAQDDGAHVLSGDKPFGLVVYGFDSFVSYGYVGGADLRKINIK